MKNVIDYRLHEKCNRLHEKCNRLQPITITPCLLYGHYIINTSQSTSKLVSHLINRLTDSWNTVVVTKQAPSKKPVDWEVCIEVNLLIRL
jgi:hypothetical protein